MKIEAKAKACKDRLFSVAVNPTTDMVLAMDGDKWGRLGLWNIVSPVKSILKKNTKRI